MVAFFQYRSPTTPGNPGWAEGLGNDTVRLASIQGIVQEAQLGAVGISSIVIDDPDADVGHSGDAIVGLKQFDWTENAAPSGRRRIWTGYIGDRRYRRGDEQRRSLILAASRVIDATLVDINSFLSFRLFTTTAQDPTSDFNRPVESDVDRIAALLAVDFLSTTLFDGLVSATDPVQMDANDYAGQRPIDVLNDCAQQSGKNFFVFYDEAGTYTTAGNFALFYDFNDAAVYPANCSFSNVTSDWSSTCFGPAMNAELVKDPSRICSGVFMDYDGGSVYRTETDVGLTTSGTFGWRDQRFSSSNIKTGPRANIRADRYLRENSTEDQTVTFSIFLSAATVNEWLPGQYGTIRFQHLPGFETAQTVRCVRRTVAQVEDTPDWYTVSYEMSISTGAEPSGDPSGASARQQIGVSFSGIPSLPRDTTPGNRLVLVSVGNGNTSVFPTAVRMKDNPATSGSPEVPPFPDADGWTVLDTATSDFTGMNVGGPSATSGLIAGISHREVAVGEVTTTPVQVSTDSGNAACGAWLWEFPTADPPVLVGQKDRTNMVNGGTATLDAVGVGDHGFAVFVFTQVDYGFQPVSVSAGAGNTIVRSCAQDNDPTLNSFKPWAEPWVVIVELPNGGTPSVTFTAIGAYTTVNYCGVVVTLPADAAPDGVLDIPFPGNQSS